MRRSALLAPLVLLSACAGGGPAATTPAAAPSGSSSASTEVSPSASPTTPTSGTPTPSTTSCRSISQGLDVQHKVGQLFMVANQGAVLDPEVRTAIRELGIGSVIYLGEPPKGLKQTRLTSLEIQGAADEIPILVSVDQEGGQVQRLSGEGFSTIPSATRQAEMSDADLAQAWRTYGRELARAGIRYDLGPVVDLVPADMMQRNAPIGQLRRGYGSDAATISAKSAAVIEGLHEAGLVTAAKHFPGIGRVSANTDFADATDTVTTAEDVQTFRDAITNGTDSVMVGSVKYDKLDPGVHAVFSKKVVTDLLRGQLGWQGAVVSDDIGAAQAVADVPAAERGLRFIQAGGDIVINADLATMDEMVGAVVDKATADQAFAASLDDHVERVLELKAKAGLLECSR